MTKQKLNKKISQFGILFFILFFATSAFFVAYAYGDSGTSTNNTSPEYIDLTLDKIVSILERFSRYFYSIAIVLAVILTVYIGITFLTAGGDDSQITKVKKMLIWLVLGVAILLIGRGIITFVRDILETGDEESALDAINLFVRILNEGKYF
ncbi:MAG: hypothetical protein US76_04335 [Parcubacteria group bacterium GW2011_GWA2_38_13b]|nr:MAG: hypothetical protein US76_04335 [Parcubacteria group bacterium GW2011_GWA2_38_13b]